MTVPAGYGFLINSRVIHRYEAGESAIIPNLVYSPHLLAAEGSLIWQKYFHPFMANGPRCLLFNPTIPWQRMCLQQMLEVLMSRKSRNQMKSTPCHYCSVSGMESFSIGMVRLMQKKTRPDV